jgi:hypothetical protein
MTTAKPPARYSAMESARACDFATPELHHPLGHDHLFRRVSSETNEMMDYRAGRRRQSERVIAQTAPERRQARPLAKGPERRMADEKVRPPASMQRRFAQPRYPLRPDGLWPQDVEELLGRW